MKIAIVHNDYGKYSGEEAVVDTHCALLQKRGHEISFFRRSSKELRGSRGAIKAFFSGLYNPFSKHAFARFLDKEHPDIVHIHNLYPLIHPCILPEASRRNIPVVMTMHNFRLFCPNGLFLCQHEICEKCAQKKSIIPCLTGNCLNSRVKTLAYALRTLITQYSRWYENHVSLFLCLTEFQRKKMISYGLPAEKTAVFPNILEENWSAESESNATSEKAYIAYLGRLSPEKGIEDLLDAAKKLPDISFRIAGNGAENYQKNASENVEFCGYLSGHQKIAFLQNAKIHVMTSRCYESFPTTLLQGMSLGIPSIVPDHGAMPDIIQDAGCTYQPGKLADTIRSVWNDKNILEQYQTNAKKRIQMYLPDICILSLENIYSRLLAAKDSK